MKKTGRYTICVLLGLAPLAGILAQNGTKTVVDATTRQPLDFVSIQSDNNSTRLMSNREGKFTLIPDERVKTYSFYRMGYRKLVLKREALQAADSIYLQEQEQELAEVVVSSEKLQPVVKDKRFYVDDYCILPNNDFVLITSKTVSNDFEVRYYSWSKGIRCSKTIKNEPGARLVTDCFKNIQLLTDHYSRQLFFDSDSSFQFLPRYGRKTFDSTLAACALRIDTQVIIKQTLPPIKIELPNFSASQNAPFMNYVRVSPHTRSPFYFVEYNAHMREMIEHEMSDFQLFGQITYKEECNIMLFFKKIAAPLYAPLHLKNDTVVLFDFQEQRIVFLNSIGKVLQQVALDQEQFVTMRDFEILYDAPAQEFYLKMRDANRSYIKHINIYTGKIDRTVKLEKIFASNIQIANNQLYYLVREKGWDDTQYLYRQN